jgi:hypothetical protein
MIKTITSTEGRRLNTAWAEGDVVLSVSFFGSTYSVIVSEIELGKLMHELTNLGQCTFADGHTTLEMVLRPRGEVILRIAPARKLTIEEDPETSIYLLATLKTELINN